MWLFPKLTKITKANHNDHPTLQKLDDFINAKEPEVVKLLCHFWGDQKNAVTYKELIGAYQTGYAEQIQAWQEDYAVFVNEKLAPIWRSAMKAAAAEHEKKYGKFYNDSDYYVKDWLGKHGTQFVTNIGDEQRKAIRSILTHAQDQGWGAEKTSRAIRPLIGLTAPQTAANVKYKEHIKQTLIAEHPRMKKEAVESKAEVAALKYAVRQQRQRAYTIATTELAFAYNRGAHESVRQAQAAGLMGQVIKRWSTAFDERVCPRCGALDGKEIGMGDNFDFAKKELFTGQFQTPPAHPKCRCAVEYEETDAPDPVELKMQQLSADIATATTELAKIPVKTYSGIWKDDVTTLQWKEKKDSVQGKRDYFQQKIVSTPTIGQKFHDLLAQLEEFDAEGRKHFSIQDKISNLEFQYESLQKYGKIVDNPYSKQRKDAAYWFKTTKDADTILRDKCSEVWRGATKAQREAIYDYTSASGAFNRPLSGYQKPYAKGGSGWEKVYYKGIDKVWINYEGKGNKIRNMTRVIEKSMYDFDIWLQRGCDYNAMESFFGMDVSAMDEADMQAFIQRGYKNRISSFVSTSINKGAGFSGKPVIMNIYVPRGTPIMYVEPFSAYGKGGGKGWNGKSIQSSFGSEAEAIIQRGAMFRITKIERHNGKMYIDLEVIMEDGNDLIQQTGTWTGSKDKFK